MRLKWAKVKKNYHGVWMIGRKAHLVLNEESALFKRMILILLSDAVQMKPIKTKKASQFPKSFMIWGCMPFIGQGDMVITSTINVQVYIEIPVDFLIPSIESWFGDDKVIFLG